jgi:hypothetical protein
MGWQNKSPFSFMFESHPYTIGVSHMYALYVDASEIMAAFDYLYAQNIEDFINAGDRFGYLYDYSSFWAHTVEVEEVMPDYSGGCPAVLDGEGDCPPEDCGGVHRYAARFLGTSASGGTAKATPEREWRSFADKAPAAFDMAAVNERLLSDGYPSFSDSFGRDASETFYDGLDEDDDEGFDENFYDGLEGLGDDLDDGFDSLFMDEYLEALLGCRTKQELSSIAKLHALSGYSRLNKADLASFIAEKIGEPEYVKAVLMNMDEDELDALELYLSVEGESYYDPYSSDDDDDDDDVPEGLRMSWLARSGYYYEFAYSSSIPIEFVVAYNDIDMPSFKTEWRRFNNLSLYIRGCVNMYGIVPAETIVSIVNKQNKRKTDIDEVHRVFSLLNRRWDNILYYDGKYFLAYLDLANRPAKRHSDNDFNMLGENFGLDISYPSFDELWAAQDGIPFYVPKKEDIFGHDHVSYCKKPELVEALFDLLLKNLVSRAHYVNVAAFIAVSMFMIHIGLPLADLIAMYDSEDKIWVKGAPNSSFSKKLHDLLKDIYENSRMIPLRGHTPIEMRHMPNGGADGNAGKSLNSGGASLGGSGDSGNVVSFHSRKRKRNKRK